MKVIELTKGQVSIVDDEDFQNLAQYRWRISDSGYAHRRSMTNYKTKTLWMHREIIKCPQEMFVDHINGNKLDNRKSNLRLATKSQNAANSKIRIDSRTGRKGVGILKDGRFRARIQVNGVGKHLGEFSNIEDAKAAYDKAAENNFKEFARLN